MIRVAITTDRFEDAAPLYREAGFVPVWLPCIEIEPSPTELLDQVRLAATRADVIVLSSVRTVELLWPQGPMPSAEVVAVGKATGSAARARGGRVAYAGMSGLKSLLAESRLLFADRHVVFPHAAGTDPQDLKTLRNLAHDLADFPIYRTRSVAPPRLDVRAVVFASPTAVAGWFLTRDLTGLVVGAIGETTAEAVAHHRPPDVVAAEPSHRSLAQALASYLEVKV